MYYALARPAAAAALALLVVPALSWADESSGDEAIEQIVVVAHKDERSVRDVAANVTVLSRGELNAQLATSVGDAFNTAGLRLRSPIVINYQLAGRSERL